MLQEAPQVVRSLARLHHRVGLILQAPSLAVSHSGLVLPLPVPLTRAAMMAGVECLLGVCGSVCLLSSISSTM